MKAAIVIGVDKPGNLPKLRAAARGALDFGAWLQTQGFTVKSFVDSKGPVTVKPIKAALKRLIDRGDIEQLVVYFSGHGFNSNRTEMWLLSDAPRDADAAINLRECEDLARETGIPSIVFVSDACRSTPTSIRADRVRGSVIFPNDGVVREPRPEVDRFLPTTPGDPAYEVALGKNSTEHAGIFTTCFLKAFDAPDEAMIRRIDFEGRRISVVPNRSLKPYLRREVPAALRKAAATLIQVPDPIVESGDDVFIGRVKDKPTKPTPTRRAPPMSLSEVAAFEVRRAAGVAQPMTAPNAAAIEREAKRSGFTRTRKALSREKGPTHFETETGFKVLGATVIQAASADRSVELLDKGDANRPAVVRLSGNQPLTSIVLRWKEGGTVLAALRGYIGTVIVEDGRTANVNYVPSDNSARWKDYVKHRSTLDQLRASVAAAAHHGVFRLDKARAAAFAKKIRGYKMLDPTLGLFAAYAYADAGLDGEVQSVLGYMREDIEGTLFDVAMLARADVTRDAAPFCPMLGQGWNLLRVRRIRLPWFARQASEHLVPSLWTTFDRKGINLLIQAMRRGGK